MDLKMSKTVQKIQIQNDSVGALGFGEKLVI